VSAEEADTTLIGEVKEKTKELEKLLDDFSERLRRMRQRNRQVEQEIVSFEEDLDGLRHWLTEHT
jgi:ABC-type Fe3+-hydroxamate transport system substrate-binding protein